MRRTGTTTAALVAAALLVAGPGLVTGAAAAPVSAAPAPPAAPGFTCDERADVVPLVVRGDLRVSASCSTRYTVVLGDVRVTGDHAGTLLMTGGRVTGDVLVGDVGGEYAGLTNVEVAGSVRVTAHAGVSLDLSTVGGSVTGDARSVGIVASTVAGSVNVTADPARPHGGLHLARSDIGRWVNAYGGTPTVAASTLRRGLTLSWPQGGRVCETSVVADVVVQRTLGDVHLGGVHDADDCLPGEPATRSAFGTDLVLVDSYAPVHVAHVDVALDLKCRANRVAMAVDPATVTFRSQTGC